MNFRNSFYAIFLASSVSSISAVADVDAPRITGSAFDSDTGQLLYSELHFCDADSEASRCTVEYRDSKGSLIAQKQLDYSGSPYRPALRVRDFRASSEFALDYNEQEDLVVDAGFDNYMRAQWDELNAGDVIRFPFLPAGFIKPLKMKAQKEMLSACESNQMCLSISIDSWFIGLLADPIRLSYSLDSRRLMRFQGVSNIRGERGESLQVDIRYMYESEVTRLTARSMPNAMEYNL